MQKLALSDKSTGGHQTNWETAISLGFGLLMEIYHLSKYTAQDKHSWQIVFYMAKWHSI